MICAVTNIDSDHLNNYENSFEKLREAFLKFIDRLPFYGLAVLCIDDPVIQELIPQVNKPLITYGFSETADYRAQSVNFNAAFSEFEVIRPNHETPLKIRLNLPGNSLLRCNLLCSALPLAAVPWVPD